jgi:seryl-tRNA synthetase
MLELHTLRESKETVVAALKKRGLDAAESIDALLALDESRRSLQAELDTVLAEANHLAKEIGMLFKAGKGVEAEALKAKTADLKERSKVLQEELNEKA